MRVVTTVTALNASWFVVTLVLGAVIGVVTDQTLSPHLSEWRARRARKRALARRESNDYAGRPLQFGGVDVGLQVLFGSLGRSLDESDVSVSLLPERWVAPPDLRADAEQYAVRRGFFDGEVARLNGLEVSVTADARGVEHHRVHLEIAPTGFFDMLATNVALGPFTPETAPLLKGRGGLAETALSNMMGLDLTLVTSDGYVPVFHRSPHMAGLESCWQTSAGETVQLAVDRGTDDRPDVFMTARRGLREELGISGAMLDSIAITAFVATPEFANVGVLMEARMSMTAVQFEAALNNFVISARDNWEYDGHALIDIKDPRALARQLTDPARRWSKQAAASLIFAHALQTQGDVAELASAIHEAGELRLEPGSPGRGVFDEPEPSWASATARHCWRCAALLPGHPPVRCTSCGQEHYANPKPCGEALVVHEGEVLLVRRAQDPWRGCWDVPGGFCAGDEHPLAAAMRELREEVGLLAEPVAYLGTWIDTYGPPEPDGLQQHTANVAYVMVLTEATRPDVATVQDEEVLEARWFSLQDLPQDLAFPDHTSSVLRLLREWSADQTRGAGWPDPGLGR